MNIGVHISFELVFLGFFGYPCMGLLDGCESWTVKKGECQKIDAFELWCWRRLPRLPWTAGRSNQSILKKVNPEYALELLMMKLQDFSHLCEELTPLKRPWCWERLKARGEGGDRGWDGWKASLNQWTWVWVNSRRCWWKGGLVCCSPWGPKESDTTERPSNNRFVCES